MMVPHHTKKELSRIRSFTVSKRKHNLELFAVVYELGEDCLVILYGGARPHIGAIGIAQARPSSRDPEVVSATSSVFTYVGHEEDMVAKSMSEELARKRGGCFPLTPRNLPCLSCYAHQGRTCSQRQHNRR